MAGVYSTPYSVSVESEGDVRDEVVVSAGPDGAVLDGLHPRRPQRGRPIDLRSEHQLHDGRRSPPERTAAGPGHGEPPAEFGDGPQQEVATAARHPRQGNCELIRLPLAIAMTLGAVPGARAHAQSQPTVIELAPYLDAWTFRAEIGGVAGTFLFDTGGGIIVLSPAAAAKSGCQPWGQLTGFRMRGDRVDMKRCDDVTLRANGLTIGTATAGVFELSTLLPPRAPTLAGSVALDSFGRRIVTIDLANRQIVIETRASWRRRVAHATEIEMRLAREMAGQSVVPFIAVRSGGRKLWMELYTGSDSSVILGSQNANAVTMRTDGAQRQPFRAELSTGLSIAVDDAKVTPLIFDGNIGSKVLRNWTVTIDLGRARAWIATRARPMPLSRRALRSSALSLENASCRGPTRCHEAGESGR